MTSYFMRKFPVKCYVWEVRGNDIVKHEDKGRTFFNDKGDIYFRLKNRKRNTVPVPLEYFYTISTDVKDVNELHFISPSRSLYFPIKLSAEMDVAMKSGNVSDVLDQLPEKIREELKRIKENTTVKIPIDEKLESWLDWEGFRIYKNSILTDFKGGLEKYLPQIVLVVVMIVAAVSMVIIYQGMNGMVQQTSAVQKQVLDINQQFIQKYIDLDNRLLTLIESGKIPVIVTNPPPAGI